MTKKDDHQADQELEVLQRELEQMTELAKRTMADLTNLKRRNEEERSQIFLMANAELIRKLLPEFDNLERAKSHLPKEAEEWFKGIEMSMKNIEKALQESGLEKIPTVGESFNPNLHEALLEGPGAKDLILEEFEPGYKIGERVIRHAKVKVGNGLAPSEEI